MCVKMTVNESTTVTVGGRNPMYGTSAVGGANKDGDARERGLLNGGISSAAEAYMRHAHTAHCCEHLGRLRDVPVVAQAKPPDPQVAHDVRRIARGRALLGKGPA